MQKDHNPISLITYIRDIAREGQLREALANLQALRELLGLTLFQSQSHTIISLSGRFHSNAREHNDGILSGDEYKRENNKIRVALLSVIDEIEHDLNRGITPAFRSPSAETRPAIRTLLSPLNAVAPKHVFEKLIKGGQLLAIHWLEEGMQAARSVCKVRTSTGDGTGFVLAGGYLLTNSHVLPDKATVENATIIFNYEETSEGGIKPTSVYPLDSSECYFSPFEAYDYAYVKIKDNPQNPLSQWGALKLETQQKPKAEDALCIVQHPRGRPKAIAFGHQEVLSVWNHHLFYTVDTEPGSSGSPVFNLDWKVIALHHAGLTMEEGGFQINAQGDKAAANRGILIQEVMANLAKQGAVGHESKT